MEYNASRNYFCVQPVIARSLAERKNDDTGDCPKCVYRGTVTGAGGLHEPVRPRSASGRRRPARGRCGRGDRRCGRRRAWRRNRRGGWRRHRCRDRRRYDTGTTAAATSERLRVWPGLRLPAATRTERLWLPAPAAALSFLLEPVSTRSAQCQCSEHLARRRRSRGLLRCTRSDDQLGGADLICSARYRVLAAGGRLFPSADASMRGG